MIPPHEFETGRLTLRKPLASDTESIFLAYAGDADVTRYITWPPARSIADTQVAVNEMLACWENGSEYSWAIILKQENQLMGMIAVRPFGARVDLGYVLGKRFWDNGYMTEAGTVIVEWLLERDEIFRVGATCDVDNLASARVLEKLGMHREGILRRWAIHPNISDKPRDCLSYARVK